VSGDGKAVAGAAASDNPTVRGDIHPVSSRERLHAAGRRPPEDDEPQRVVVARSRERAASTAEGGIEIVRQRKLSRALLLLGSVAIAIAWTMYTAPEAAADHCSRGQGTLTGPGIKGKVPSGKASWQRTAFCQPLELQVEVKDVNLPDGTALSVDACPSGTTSNIVGSITLGGGAGKLLLSKLDGDPTNDNVPFCDMRFGFDKDSAGQHGPRFGMRFQSGYPWSAEVLDRTRK
jgi:hypothetical protein